MIGKIKTFSNEVVKEMKKVSWPTREQLKESTNVVVITTLIITLIVYVIDLSMSTLINLIF
ncbi:preprotein translocase subunit SecE [Bacteroidetes/Chlorobi group bacterium ChocPot_Mid]|jgi:preprotein translocase subunit SecE|nr:MAG: preprotein translocase subunit SecE [Bacteroidetes/Chlorobi group bacterium ChocPot_Mid]